MMLVFIWIASTSRGYSNDCQQHMLLERGRYKHTGCNVKTKILLDCGLIGVCVEIRSNMVVLLKKLTSYLSKVDVQGNYLPLPRIILIQDEQQWENVHLDVCPILSPI